MPSSSEFAAKANVPSDVPVLRVEDVVKRFGATLALDKASIDFLPGTIHALVGANGSGKSTLSKVLTGVIKADSGIIRLNGTVVTATGRSLARSLGLATVFQETSLVPDMTVAENIWLTREPRSGFVVDRAKLRRGTEDLIRHLSDVAPGIAPETPVSRLGPDQKQLVELMKALSQDPDILILDEATACLDSRQAVFVAGLAKARAAAGRTVIFITHRMREVFDLADRISVLRNGQVVGTFDKSELDAERLVGLMIGDEVKMIRSAGRRSPARSGRPGLRAEVAVSKTGGPVVIDVSPGEVLGIGGLQQQGQSQVLYAIFEGGTKLKRLQAGGVDISQTGSSHSVRHGIALVPGDRNREGLFSAQSIFFNAAAAVWDRFGRPYWISVPEAKRHVAALASELKLKAASLDARVGTLSGGNAQKVVLMRWLAIAPKFLLLDDPTKGIDVNAKADFYQALRELRDSGAGVILYSSDADELEALCDRVVVMFEGQVVAELTGDRVNADVIARTSVTGFVQ